MSRRSKLLPRRPVLTDPALWLAPVPLAALASYATGNAIWIMGAGLVFPLLCLALRAAVAVRRPDAPADALTGLPGRGALESFLDDILSVPGNAGRTCACLVLDLDGFHALNERWGRDAADRVLKTTAHRLRDIVRPGDMVARLDADAFAVVLTPSDRLTLDAVLSVGERMLRAIAEPIAIDSTNAYVSGSVGIALASKVEPRRGPAMVTAAERAMVEARRHGAGALRVYAPQMLNQTRASHALGEDVARGLEEGQVKAWFQPQVSTDTGRVTGFEALARWTHPTRGPVAPSEFIPAVEAAGRSERLGEVMLYEALAALVAWERAGFRVPTVGVNFAGTELRNPRILEKVKWELDRFGLTPDRLSVEVLENVMTEAPDDIILRNVAALGKLGCRIDLDDFGTGHASIAAIRRFGITRIKIDRSFIRRVDQDGDQQRMACAILTMAHQMGIESLAEGVENTGEHSILGQLGCDHVQGFGIARPMPLEESFDWLRNHSANLRTVTKIGVAGRSA